MRSSLEEISKLSVPERIQRVEDVWDSIAEAAGDLPVSDSHREELARRREVWAAEAVARARSPAFRGRGGGG